VYLHIGGDVVVDTKSIVAVIDVSSPYQSDVNREFIQVAEIEGLLKPVALGYKTKSCVITSDKVFLSSISSATLRKRVMERILE